MGWGERVREREREKESERERERESERERERENKRAKVQFSWMQKSVLFISTSKQDNSSVFHTSY